ncbi:MAG: Glycine cleavage H-protein [Ignavibacteria bacterium]|nr:Glycine cleavage H-protein [Ignavibacteria bacterium]
MSEKVRILAVDDEQIILDSIKKSLKDVSDIELCFADSVSDALSKIEGANFDIILTDLMMPGIDGLEFLRILKSKAEDILVIMITGYATISTALQALQLGAFDYLAKPFTKDEIKKVIKRASELSILRRKSFPKGISKNVNNNGQTTYQTLKGIGQDTWINCQEDGTLLLGIERLALTNIGNIQTFYLPSEGDILRQGCLYLQIFTSDFSSYSFLSPLSGTILKVNHEILSNPDILNCEGKENNWILKLQPSNYESEIKLIVNC